MSGLRREVGLPAVVATSTGLPFAALEYLAAASLIAYVAGDAAWIAIGVAGLLALLSAAFFSELNGLFPTAAAIRLYMSRALNDNTALTITFTYLTTITLVIAADAYIVGRAITYTVGSADWLAAVYIALILGFAAAANLRGIRIAGLVQAVATIAVITGTIAVVLVALGKDGFALDGATNPFGDGHGAGDFFQAVALGVFLYAGFEWVTANAEEVRDPTRRIPRGMFISIGILFVTCALISIGMSHLLTESQLDLPYPQLFLGDAAAGTAGLWLMMGITGLTAINTCNGGFVTASRFMYATAREGSLPPSFAHLNRWAVPWLPVVVLATVSLVLALGIALTGQWKVVVAVGAALEAGIYAAAGICVYRLRSKLPDAERPFRVPGGRVLVFAGIAVFGVLALAAGLTVDDKSNPAPLLIIIGLGLASAAFVVFRVPGLRAAEEKRRKAAAARRRERRERVRAAGAKPALPESAD